MPEIADAGSAWVADSRAGLARPALGKEPAAAHPLAPRPAFFGV